MVYFKYFCLKRSKWQKKHFGKTLLKVCKDSFQTSLVALMYPILLRPGGCRVEPLALQCETFIEDSILG